MRFAPDGPSIPDELLTARDEGSVVFFCGAGVSFHKAKLPNFVALTSMVLDALGADDEDDARRLMRTADALKGSGAAIHMDRIFGLLEREFAIEDVRMEVAKALQPPADVDLSAHRIMLDLSRAPDGSVRLVTTNFDRLFEAAAPDLRSWAPPDLPDLRRLARFDGIAHLHGMTNADYTGSMGDDFVVSSADFGQAYLMDGWAATFMRHLLRRYQLVFVGYQADDPPIRYLLEALGRSATSTTGLYAFDVGTSAEVRSRWEAKGVQAIAVDASGGFDALWATLEAWAAKARDPGGWTASVIEMAQRGPRGLAPHERGQIAHLVSTLDGARAFSSANPPPPAEWLCAFDPALRFGRPGVGDAVDPFDLYGLDDDPVPARIVPDNYWAERNMPASVWDAFHALAGDVLAEHTSTFTGDLASAPAPLAPRLWALGRWLSAVSHQPAAVWWVGIKRKLHPSVQKSIKSTLYHQADRFPAAVKRAWRLILASWEQGVGSSDHDWEALRRELSRDGWSASMADRIEATLQPRLTISPTVGRGPVPPSVEQLSDFRQLVYPKVVYPDWGRNIAVPNEHLPALVGSVRRMLERAVALETEIGGFGPRLEHPLAPDPDDPPEEISHERDLDRLVRHYVDFYKRLADSSKAQAEKERAAWPCDDRVFARLRMWVAGQPQLTGPTEAGRLLARLPRNAFWDEYHQRDLLVSIASRWGQLPRREQTVLARILMKGPQHRIQDNQREHKAIRAWWILQRVYWLLGRGIRLPVDPDTIEELRREAPDWREEYARRAAASFGSRVGWGHTVTAPEPLLAEPVSTLIGAAARERRRDPENWLREFDPFPGFVIVKPVRALAGLRFHAKEHPFPQRQWEQFLHPEARKTDKPRLSALIARRLAALPFQDLASISHEVSAWIGHAAEALFQHFPAAFDSLWRTMLELLRKDQIAGLSALVHSNQDHDWLSEAWNTPSGRLCRALFRHPATPTLHDGDGLPDLLSFYLSDLLTLPNRQRLCVIAVLGTHLGRLHAIDPAWTEDRLLKSAETDEETLRAALLDGFAHNPASKLTLYQRIKPLVLASVSSATGRREKGTADFLLTGWAGLWDSKGTRHVSDTELRTCLLHGRDEFRSQVLGRLSSWARDEGENWRSKVLEFLRSVWPRQTAVNNPQTTAGLCGLLMTLGDRFPEGVEMVLSRIARFDQHTSLYLHEVEDLDDPDNALVARFPSSVLALLSKVLPLDVRLWPHNTRAILTLIGQREPSLATERRFLELRRQLDSV